MLIVTFDTNVIELVLDEDRARKEGDAYLHVYEAIRDGRIKGYVSRIYFAHDAILKKERMDKLCGDIEICVSLRKQDNSAFRFTQMSKILLDEFHTRTLNRMNELGVLCLDFQRKFWPTVDFHLPMCNPPDYYDERYNAIRVYIENELRCGFARFRQYLRTTVGAVGDDMRLLFQLKEQTFDRGSFDKAFAEAGDGDSLAAHYGYHIGLFCTNDRASHAGRDSIFSSYNRQKLKQCFDVKIVSVEQLDQILQGTQDVRGGSFDEFE